MILDEPRLARLLARLLPHLDADNVAITGGIAVELHLRAAGKPPLRDHLADVDLVVRRMDAVAVSVSRDLLISHDHLVQPSVRNAIVQLVDPVSRLRVDIFHDRAGMVSDARRHCVAGTELLVVSAASLLAYKLQMLTKPVDPKHWRDAVALSEVCGAVPPARPTEMVADVYSTDVTLVCERCELSRSPDFPIARKSEIFEVIGYV